MSITTEEQRRQLEVVGWKQVKSARTGPQPELWMRGVLCDVTITSDGRMTCTGDLRYAAEFAAILQIPIPGYRIVREEGAPDVTA